MPGDAFMEVSHPDVWGEQMDEQFDAMKKLGGFEISNFQFTENWDPDPPSDTEGMPNQGGQQGGFGSGGRGLRSRGIRGPNRAPTSQAGRSNTAGSTNQESPVKVFSIQKAIDKASPDLFLICCRKLEMDWAIVSLREAGEMSGARKAFLVFEFSGLQITSFGWTISPGAAEDAANQEESITFSFKKILIKYRQQDASGGHEPPLIKGFDVENPLEGSVTERFPDH